MSNKVTRDDLEALVDQLIPDDFNIDEVVEEWCERIGVQASDLARFGNNIGRELHGEAVETVGTHGIERGLQLVIAGGVLMGLMFGAELGERIERGEYERGEG